MKQCKTCKKNKAFSEYRKLNTKYSSSNCKECCAKYQKAYYRQNKKTRTSTCVKCKEKYEPVCGSQKYCSVKCRLENKSGSNYMLNVAEYIPKVKRHKCRKEGCPYKYIRTERGQRECLIHRSYYIQPCIVV